MIYLKKFTDSNILNIYKKSNFISPHVFYEIKNKSFHYLEIYQRIEYLESTGTQYISTNIIPNSETGIGVKYLINDIQDRYMVGLRDTTGDTRWCIGTSFASSGSSGIYYGYGTFNDGLRPSSTSINNIHTSFLNYFNSKTFIIDNYSYNIPNSLSFIPQNDIRLFGSSGINGSYSSWIGRIYECKITQDNELICDFIPVRKNGVGYMYDKISGLFFSNKGTDEFILGPDI